MATYTTRILPRKRGWADAAVWCRGGGKGSCAHARVLRGTISCFNVEATPKSAPNPSNTVFGRASMPFGVASANHPNKNTNE